MSLLFNMVSRFIIAFLPRSKCLLISWLQPLSAVILEPKKIKSVIASTFPHLFAMKWWDQMPWSWFFNVEFQGSFFSLLFHLIQRLCLNTFYHFLLLSLFVLPHAAPPTCLQRNLYASQETTVRTGHGTMDWFKLGKGVKLYIVILLI